MNWAAIIGAAVQLVFLILSNRATKDKEEKEKHEAIARELKEAVNANDNARISLVLEKLRLRRP